MHHIMEIANRIGLRKYSTVKYGFDLVLWAAAAPLAFILRLDNTLGWWPSILIYTGIGTVIKAALILGFGLYRQSWHKVGVRDLLTLLQTVGLGILFLLGVGFITNPVLDIPRSIPILDGILGLVFMGALRLGLRIFDEQQRRVRSSTPRKRVLIVGAGETGTLLAREMIRHPEAGMKPVGYLDDDSNKRDRTFVGFPVLGALDDLPAVVKRRQVDEVLIAMPSASGSVVRKVVDLAQKADVRYRIIPGIYEILSEKVSISQIREVDVEDLLRRAPVQLDMQPIAEYLDDQVVLVTGAAGTIGSEIVRQVTRFNPRKLILIDHNENALYMMHLHLQRTYPYLDFLPLVADIQRPEKLDRIFQRQTPDVIFHAAAHKHVPFMDLNPDEAILNNVFGTRNMLDMALRYRVERFVNISTDKAVRPSSVMGASKRLAEYLVTQTASRVNGSRNAFVSVRFGNVLGSNGSVIPIFKEQIRQGGPVTVTHPDMTRYFMSVPEATQLVLQAGSFGKNGAIYILDMGDPVRIVDLAYDLIRLSGLEPGEDIPIEFIGKRPGEKLYEELRYEDEHPDESDHEKILVVRPQPLPEDFNDHLEALLIAARMSDPVRIREMLCSMIPAYEAQAEIAYAY